MPDFTTAAGAMPQPECSVPLAPRPADFTAFPLWDNHREHLRESGLSDATIAASSICSLTQPQLIELGFPAEDFPSAMVIPYSGMTGVYRVRPDWPSGSSERPKYLTRAGGANRLYVPEPTGAVLETNDTPLLIVEGEKKTLAAQQCGFHAVGLAGVYGWRCAEHGVVPDFDNVKWRGRDVRIAFDSDMATHPEVREALRRLVAELQRRHAEVRVVLLPHGEGGAKVGLDDHLAVRGEAAVQQVVEAARPLFEVALEFLSVVTSDQQLNDVVAYLCRVIALYPALEDTYREQLQQAMQHRRLTPPGKRAMQRMIGDARKKDEAATKAEQKKVEAQELARQFVRDQGTDRSDRRILHWLNGVLYRFDDRCYHAVSAQGFLRDVTVWLQDQELTVTQSLVRDVVLNVEAYAKLPDSLSPPCWLRPDRPLTSTLLPVASGVVQVQFDKASVGYSPFGEPHWLCTHHLPVHYDGGAQCPRWLAFLEQVFQRDAQRVARLQEWFGHHLDLEPGLEKFALFAGSGANGKSVVLAVLQAMLGEEAAVAIPIHRLAERFNLGRLRGVLANIVGDLEETDRASEGVLKQLVSREPVMGEAKFGDPFLFRPLARHTFATNTLPRFRDRTEGLWRRVLLFPFTWTVPEPQRDLYLARRLIHEELSGIFNWAMAGAFRLRQQQRFTASTVADEALARYRRQCDPVGVFVDECCAVGPTYNVAKQALYSAYRRWAEHNGHKPMATARFSQELYRVAPAVTDARPRGVNETRPTVYEGIGLVNGNGGVGLW